MITDTKTPYTLENRSLSSQELLEIECARRRFADLTNRDCEKGDFAFTNDRLAFASSLEKRYGEASVREYIMFHLLTGSTPNRPLKHYDLPSVDSVKKFLETKYQQLISIRF